MPEEGRPLVESCSVREGILTEDRGVGALAVDIDAIVREDTPTAYDDPSAFFRMTYPTQALSTIAKQVFERTTGVNPHARGIFLLGTALGGGKSHILASLLHMARNGSNALPEEFKKALDNVSFPPVRVAVLTQNSPAGDKEPPRTLWGHLAEQLGSYDKIADFDKKLQSPTKDVLLSFLEGEPVLILMDELTNYLIRAAAISAGEGSLAEQTRVFFQSLEEAVDLRTNTALVISQLPEEFEPSDEEATLKKVTKGLRGAKKEEIRDRALRETRLSAKLLLRKAETQNPVRDDTELTNILRRRVFEDVNPVARDEVARVYEEYYRAPGRRAVLPTDAVDPDLRKRMSQSYPFHPRTISLLRDKLGQAPKFMQTRGALLLPVLAVKRLHETKSGSPLIHPFHFDPRDELIRQELGKRVFDDERVENAIQTELVDNQEPSRAGRIDTTFGSELGARLTTAILLESALVTSRGEKDPIVGADEANVLLDVLQPGDDETRAENALKAVLETSYHILPIGEKLVFRGEVNLNKFIEDKAKGIRPHRINDEIRRRVRTYVLKGSSLFDSVWWPTSPEEIPDRPGLRLAILPPADPWWISEPKATEKITSLFMTKNQASQPRIYRNSLVVLAPDASHGDNMIGKVRRRLAVQDIYEDGEFRTMLSEEQEKALEREKAKAEALATLRIGMGYRMLFYPSAKGEYKKPTVVCTTLRLSEADLGVDSESFAVRKSRALEVITRRLVDEDKLRKAEYSPEFIREKVFADRSGKMAESRKYGEVEDAFFKDPRLSFIESKEIVRHAVLTGVGQDTWLILSGDRVFSSRTGGEPVLHEDSELILYDTDRARATEEDFCLKCGRRKDACECGDRPPSPPPELCPFCHQPLESCKCGEEWPNLPLQEVPGRVAELAKKKNAKISSVVVQVNKVGDVAFLLRLSSTLAGAKLQTEVGALKVSVDMVNGNDVGTSIQADRPREMWSTIKTAVEGLLAQITSGKGQGKARANLIMRFRQPAGADEVEDALRPLSMSGAEAIKAANVRVKLEESE